MSQFTDRLKFVKKEDLFAIIPMAVGFLISLVVRIKHNNVWLICERKSDARDNGYWFYRYMFEKHPEIESVYAIDRNSSDYQKVVSLGGRVIQFGSLTHWIYYWLAKKNISSQKEGKPNAAICYILEVYLGARKNRVYLKHGIIKDYQRWIFKDVSKINLLVCAAEAEYNYINDNFGYTKDELTLSGLSRFDNLLTPHETKRQILIMPTMREWLRNQSSDTLKYEGTMEFTESEYYKTWTHLIYNPELDELLNKNNVDLVFYPHASLHKYIDDFKTVSGRIVIGNSKDYDVQQLLMESALLITDYSSIYFDFAYMLKPLIYYQFDYEKYRRGQYQQGYFSYKDNGFGPVVQTEDDLLDTMESILINGIKMKDPYLTRAKSFYAFHDTKNRERTFNAIKNMKER